MNIRSLAICLFLPVLASCATTYDPAEVCTADWIQPRATKAVKAIEKDTRSVMKNLRRVADSYVDGKRPGFLDMWRLEGSFKGLENEFENGRGVRDLRILARTCDDPQLVADSLTDFMRDQGLPDGIINFITSMDKFREVTDPDFGLEET